MYVATLFQFNRFLNPHNVTFVTKSLTYGLYYTDNTYDTKKLAINRLKVAPNSLCIASCKV